MSFPKSAGAMSSGTAAKSVIRAAFLGSANSALIGRLSTSGAGMFLAGAGKFTCRALVHWDSVFAQAATSGLFAALRTRHDAERSVGKMAAILAAPQ
jgi:hypothetical protein